MDPVVFGDSFGWLHPGAGRHGVVLCSPFGYDALCTHRGWRRLAERLAATGMPTLRFDYPGTGDALGDEEDPGRVDAWIDAIAAAVRELRTRTGVTRVSLCGLRLGATLAALAAERMGDIDGLVLLSPPVLGKSYVRELRAHRQSWLSTAAGRSAEPIPDTAAYVEAFGFGLHGDDIARLAAVDLCANTCAPARRVLLLDSSDRARAGALVERYRAHGVEVERTPFDEADTFLREALYSQEPVAAFAKVTGWLAAACADATAHADAPPCGPQSPETPRVAGPHFIEEPVAFGGCFGIVCRPRGARADAPAMLFLNTGASHHIGDGRTFVLFARRLAAQGITSLRMDLAGIGDSASAEDAVTLDTIYSDASCRDACKGADWLVESGYASVVVFGVCGGAFVGLHACATHPGIVGCVGVNLQKFIWLGEARIKASSTLASNRVLRHSVLSLEKWKRVLRGESSLAFVVRGLSQRLVRRVVRGVADALDQTTGWSFAPNEARRLLQRTSAKHAKVRLVYGEYDRGLDELTIQFGPRRRGLRSLPEVHVETLPKLDHALFTRDARDAAMHDANQWFVQQFVAHDVSGSATSDDRLADGFRTAIGMHAESALLGPGADGA
jgi:pimeloyl-ACP methyl ester carboxylesterase